MHIFLRRRSPRDGGALLCNLLNNIEFLAEASRGRTRSARHLLPYDCKASRRGCCPPAVPPNHAAGWVNRRAVPPAPVNRRKERAVADRERDRPRCSSTTVPNQTPGGARDSRCWLAQNPAFRVATPRSLSRSRAFRTRAPPGARHEAHARARRRRTDAGAARARAEPESACGARRDAPADDGDALPSRPRCSPPSSPERRRASTASSATAGISAISPKSGSGASPITWSAARSSGMPRNGATRRSPAPSSSGGTTCTRRPISR